jgi:hypothetical protein
MTLFGSKQILAKSARDRVNRYRAEYRANACNHGAPGRETPARNSGRVVLASPEMNLIRDHGTIPERVTPMSRA